MVLYKRNKSRIYFNSELSAMYHVLLKQGFLVNRQLLPKSFIQQLTHHANELKQNQDAESAKAHRSLGSLISLWEDPFFYELITHKKLLNLFQSIGATDLRYSNGYLLAKPPHSPATFWHQDWWMWSLPGSYTKQIYQLGVLLYLDSTNPQNGCLRVIPGSHRKPHELHQQLMGLDNKTLRRAEQPDSTPYQNHPDQLDLPLEPGDIVILDARLLHGAHANLSDFYRRGIVLWYYPNYQQLPEPAQARIGHVELPPHWPQDLLPFLPHYRGLATAQDICCNPDFPRDPGNSMSAKITNSERSLPVTEST